MLALAYFCFLKAIEKVQDDSFGGKEISFFGSLTLLVNNITGPGMASKGLLFWSF
jgi:hypothetical protein